MISDSLLIEALWFSIGTLYCFPLGKGCFVDFVENVNSSLNPERTFCIVNYNPSHHCLGLWHFCAGNRTESAGNRTESNLIFFLYPVSIAKTLGSWRYAWRLMTAAHCKDQSYLWFIWKDSKFIKWTILTLPCSMFWDNH